MSACSRFVQSLDFFMRYLRMQGVTNHAASVSVPVCQCAGGLFTSWHEAAQTATTFKIGLLRSVT
jgi:hypothetical protein